jgi:ADP-heptose:LPS heptosyltransferase
LIDDWLPFPGFPGIPEGWQGPRATVDFCRQVQDQAYDLILQIHGSGNAINPFLTLLGGRHQAGFYQPGQYHPDSSYFLPYPNQGSEADRLLALMTFLGCPEQGRDLEFPIHEAEYQRGLQLLDAHSLLPGQYLCLHAGASSDDRRWSWVGFTQVAQQLASQGHRIVLTGTPAERDLAHQILIRLNQPGTPLPVNLAGRTSLGALAVLLRHSALLISNDTGVSHLAAALKVPSVVVFTNSDLQRWAPHNATLHPPIDSRETGPTTVAAVLAQAHQRLQPHGPNPSPLEVCHAL